jgi:uracil-DNA glycosylase family protein
VSGTEVAAGELRPPWRESVIARQAPKTQSARDYIPPFADLRELRTASEHCRGCPLYRNATQTVFGEGSAKSQLVLVGEAPGNDEDLEGRPFVGPAGRLLADALERAGIERRQVYLTNAVKHFKFEPRGKVRIHKKPTAREIAACKPWLEEELRLLQPEALVCLGATAAQALIGKDFRVTKQRGRLVSSPHCAKTLATYHPSAVLRAPNSAQREAMKIDLIDDLTTARRILEMIGH